MPAAEGSGISVLRGDITLLDVDAIVNAANEQLAPGGGVCGAIHRAAGPGLAEACRGEGFCPTGSAKITRGFDLPARYVIHAVGPVWHGGGAGEADLLRGCYETSLALARDKGLSSIAFPAISTGIFGYPLEAATAIAVAAAKAWLARNAAPDRIVFAVFDQAAESAYKAAIETSS